MPKNGFTRKIMILTPLQKLTKNGEDWGKLIFAKGFKKLPKVQNIAQSGHTGNIADAFCLMSFKLQQCANAFKFATRQDLAFQEETLFPRLV